MTDTRPGGAQPTARAPSQLTASVIIPAFTLDRWDKLVKAVDAVQAQTRPPVELILCIDRNPELLRTCLAYWEEAELRVPIKIIPNYNDWTPSFSTESTSDGVRRGYGGGSARQCAAGVACGEILVTFDDDAWPERNCIEYLLGPYEDPSVVAVGGKTVPDFETTRPIWFPRTFDWIFGCSYEGLPTELAPTPRLIGANLSVRASAFRALGGYASPDFDDLDLSTRLAYRYSQHGVVYEPRAVAHHYVSANRVTWHYFWSRSFLVNRDKVPAFAAMGPAANLSPEFSFVVRAVRAQLSAVSSGMPDGRAIGVMQLGAMVVGIAFAGLGNIVGRVVLWVRRLSARLAD
ncbi:putative glycosyltransferase [Mycobacteroides abscessus subsp. abscessus]|nr:putative glycosyltransferase [Mycobacteroides abscessus subsp. abscessus]